MVAIHSEQEHLTVRVFWYSWETVLAAPWLKRSLPSFGGSPCIPVMAYRLAWIRDWLLKQTQEAFLQEGFFHF